MVKPRLKKEQIYLLTIARLPRISMKTPKQGTKKNPMQRIYCHHQNLQQDRLGLPVYLLSALYQPALIESTLNLFSASSVEF